jgi:glycosyltransferase involved in cell wall biosynthesis
MRTVSVIIPVLDRRNALVRAVTSVICQTYPISELIVVDDGSLPPISASILPTSQISTMVIRHDTNLGPGAARQTGIDHASGAFLAFLDSDDYWLDTKIEQQVSQWERRAGGDPLVAVSCGWQHVDVQRHEEYPRIPCESTRAIEFASGCWFCPGSTALVCREAFTIIGPFDSHLRRLEDFEWFLRFGLAGGKMIVAPLIGAVVNRNRCNIQIREMKAAVDRISRVCLARTSPLTSAQRRHLKAWLNVELAAAHYQHQNPIRASLHLLRSFLAVPRTRLQLRNWWTNSFMV